MYRSEYHRHMKDGLFSLEPVSMKQFSNHHTVSFACASFLQEGSNLFWKFVTELILAKLHAAHVQRWAGAACNQRVSSQAQFSSACCAQSDQTLQTGSRSHLLTSQYIRDLFSTNLSHSDSFSRHDRQGGFFFLRASCPFIPVHLYAGRCTDWVCGTE